MSLNLVAPVMALVLWTLIMLLWMFAVRMPAMSKAGVDMAAPEARGGRGVDLDRILPAPSNWPAHNYVHLMEQPTLFYAAMLSLVLLGQGTYVNLTLAWTYVALRALHSIWQATVNTIPIRSTLFLLSSLILIALAINGLVAALKL